jgi:methionyl-tRNA formyltransferase
MGTPQFAVPSLESLVDAGHEVLAVFTQPDRPKGRGQQLAVSPVKAAALSRGLPVFQPERIRRPEVVEQLRDAQAEAMVVVGYGQIIPQSILDLPPLGIVNVHASLLPKYRGAAPIQWAIAQGDTRTGVTTMRIDAGLDTGDMLLKAELEIGPEETAPELSERLAPLGARLLVETLKGLVDESIVPEPQNESEATLAPILRKEDGRIDWRRQAGEIYNRARGFAPWPGAWTKFRSQGLQVTRCQVAGERDLGEPGTLHLVGRRVLVSAGEGSTLELLEVQPEGRKRMAAEAFRNGQRPVENERLELGEELL